MQGGSPPQRRAPPCCCPTPHPESPSGISPAATPSRLYCPSSPPIGTVPTV